MHQASQKANTSISIDNLAGITAQASQASDSPVVPRLSFSSSQSELQKIRQHQQNLEMKALHLHVLP